MATNDEPPFLNVGTEVSAKYRGAFCEATIKIAKKLVKCKISYTRGQTDTISNDLIKGPLKIGANVEVRQSDGQYLPGSIQKLTDASTYTVVFDDGDERTLKRSSLCLKGGRHYSESESLDQMPLTDPENFGTPVHFQSKRGTRRRRHLSQSSSPEVDGPSPSKKSTYPVEFPVGRCVFLENDRRRSCWLPAVVVPARYVMDESEMTEDTICIRSFKDGRFFAAKISGLHHFAPDKEPLSSMLEGEIQPMYMCKPAIERAMAYLDTGELPWNMDLFDGKEDSNFSPNASTSCDDIEEPLLTDEQKHSIQDFYDRLKKFQDERGVPVNKQPSLAQRDLDLYKLYQLVRDNGGMEKVTQELKWRSLYLQMGMPPLANSSYIIKQAYKKYLFAFEGYEKAREEGRRVVKNYRKRINIHVQESDEDLEKAEKRVKLEKPDLETQHSSSGSQKSEVGGIESDTDSISQAGSNSHIGEETDDVKNTDNAINVPMDYTVNDRINVFYGRGKTMRTYEAKIVKYEVINPGKVIYFVHYNGWNTRYDEWIEPDRISGKASSPGKNNRASHSKKKQGRLKVPPPGKEFNEENDEESTSTLQNKQQIIPESSDVTTPIELPSVSHGTPKTRKTSTSKNKSRRRISSANETSSNSGTDTAHSPESNPLASQISSSSSSSSMSSFAPSLVLVKHNIPNQNPLSPRPVRSPTRVPPILSPDESNDTFPLKVQPEISGNLESSSEEDHRVEVKKEENLGWSGEDDDESSLLDDSMTHAPKLEENIDEIQDLNCISTISKTPPISPVGLHQTSTFSPLHSLPEEETEEQKERLAAAYSLMQVPSVVSATCVTTSSLPLSPPPVISTCMSTNTTQPCSPPTTQSENSSTVSSPASERELSLSETKASTLSPSTKQSRGTPSKRRGHDSGLDNTSESDGPESKDHTREELDFSIDMTDLESLCSTDRIGLIQERMKAIQKRYMELKSEVTYLDRKRRRARRREREAARLQAVLNQTNPIPSLSSLSSSTSDQQPSSETDLSHPTPFLDSH